MKIYIHNENHLPAISVPIVGMAVISKDRTGLPYEVWLDRAGIGRNIRHNLPRLKIKVDGNLIPFSISATPKNLTGIKITHEAQILKWISQNHEILLKQWLGEITDTDAAMQVEKLK